VLVSKVASRALPKGVVFIPSSGIVDAGEYVAACPMLKSAADNADRIACSDIGGECDICHVYGGFPGDLLVALDLWDCP